MTAINFPDNPTLNDVFTVGEDSWIWTGSAWESLPEQSPTFTDLTVTNTITGTVSSISNHTLNGLGDVNTAGATNSQVLAYNSSTQLWSAITLTSTFSGGTIANALFINNSTVSTSSTTGALRVLGGVGIVDDVYIGGSLFIEDEQLTLKARSELRFADADSTNYIGFKSPETVSTNLMWTLPATDGTSGQFLRTNGAGTLSWATASGEGGGGSVGGANTQVQYNDNGVFGGSSDFVFDSGTSTVTATNATVSTVFTVSGNTASSSPTTGAVKITGGTGIVGQLNVGGATNKFTGNTASSSTTTGTVVVTGGMGVSEDIYVGANVDIATAPTESTHATNKGYVDSTTLAFSLAFGV